MQKGKNTGSKVVNMKRIWLRDNCSNFHDSFIAKRADKVGELCSTMTTQRFCRGELNHKQKVPT